MFAPWGDFQRKAGVAVVFFCFLKKNKFLSGFSRLLGSLLFSACSFIGGGHLGGRMDALVGRGLVYLLAEGESNVS